jgi:class 3 adenylate cyclase/CheY-like chemotaxis protein
MNHIPTILVAEDENIIAKDIQKTLIKLGYKVIGSVRSGEQLLEQITITTPDLILMDINLEGKMSGIDVTREIKKEHEIPVIYLTALADNITLNEAKYTEPFGYIVKPFDEDTLRTTIEMGLYKFEIGKKLRERTTELEEERNKSEKLLRDILPSEIVDEFKENGNISPRLFKEATIIFTDFENFTSLAANMTPGALVTEINEIFMNFDMIIDKYELEKLKTIGDSYMIASGIPAERKDHADRGINAAFEMLEYLDHRNKYSPHQWNMRVGIHSGEVIAGVVGKLKYTYDVWGKSVSIAKLLERNGIPGKINISQSVKNLLQHEYRFNENSVISMDSDQIKTYFVSKSKQHS